MVTTVLVVEWTARAASGEIGAGRTPTEAFANLRTKLPEMWVDITGRDRHNESTTLVTNKRRAGGKKMAVETVKRFTSDLTGEVIEKDEDAVRVAITFPATRDRFELDAKASEVMNLIEKGNKVEVRGRKPADSNGKGK